MRTRSGGSGPNVFDDELQAQLAGRRAAATRLVGPRSAAGMRILTAPAGYVLAHNSSDIARHATLLSPLPAAGTARVVVTPGRIRGEWHLDVASRDRPGLLAAFTGVLARRGVDVSQAVLATWDGGALEAFVIRARHPPETDALQHALEAAIDEPLSSPPIEDADVTFSDDASDLYTTCDVRAGDRVGLLHALAVAIASAGADVHAARVATVNGFARDRFDLSDTTGARLGAALEEGIRRRIRSGVTGRQRSWTGRGWRRLGGTQSGSMAIR